MQISQLIQKLQKIQEELGDLEVVVETGGSAVEGLERAEKVEVEYEWLEWPTEKDFTKPWAVGIYQ